MKISDLLMLLFIFFLAFATPPTSLDQWADNFPDLSVKLKLRNLKYVNLNKELKSLSEDKCSPDEILLIKEVLIKVFHINLLESSKNSWLLTAKHCEREDSTDISCVVSEFIINDIKIKVKAN